jgi:hypothetical protein
MKFWKRDKEKKEEGPTGGTKTFLDFMTAAQEEMEGLMAKDAEWFYHLPYKGAMSREAAKELEIEKRAIWRRVIYDAKRTKLTGLRWETRSDDLVCPECRKMEGQVFSFEEYDTLNQKVMHIGCRCNLVSVRE